ncbi:MAG: tetratricopeptide repeat protein [Candidatus Polarisedimenticolaceae bacterium]|nr:tetratricopeptide repeat protein [Candidatus Polarisedimenticolaceae bacterium]
MSLINKVLVDLDQRRVDEASTAEQLLTDTAVAHPSPSHLPWVGIVVGALILLLVAVVAYWYFDDLVTEPQAETVIEPLDILPQQVAIIVHADLPEKTLKPPQKTVTNSEPPVQHEEAAITAPLPAAEHLPVPVQTKLTLQQLRVARRKVGSRIVFELNQFPQYRLIKSASNQQLNILLKKTVQAQPFQLAQYRNDLLKEISSQQDEQGLNFEFKTHQPVSTYLFLLPASGDYDNRLVIDITPIETPQSASLKMAAAPVVESSAAVASIGKRERDRSAKPPARKVVKPPPKSRPLIRHSAASKSERTYQQALDWLADGQQSTAIEGFKAVLKSDPAHHEARYSLAVLLIQRAALDEAEQLLFEGLRQAPTHAPFAKLYGRLKAESGDYLLAVTVMERAIENATTNADYYGQMAALYQRLEFHPQAIEAYTIALRLRPGMALWWMGLAISLEQRERYKEALSAYEKARANGRLNADVRTFVESRIDLLKP